MVISELLLFLLFPTAHDHAKKHHYKQVLTTMEIIWCGLDRMLIMKPYTYV